MKTSKWEEAASGAASYGSGSEKVTARARRTAMKLDHHC